MKRFMKIFLKKEQGAITYMTALLLIVLLGFTALAVDFGMHYYIGAKLQNAVDSAATAVANNLGSDDEDLNEVAYDYLARNGFDRNGKYKDRIDVKVESRNVHDIQSVDDDRYITEGYYKVTVKLQDSTLFARTLGSGDKKLDFFDTEKHAYVKCAAHYVDVPRALKYSIFAGSTEDKPNGNKAMMVTGRTGQSVNQVGDWLQNTINALNVGLFQPIKAFFGGTPDYNDLVTIKFSEILTDGDVHSNSNIEIGVDALNVSRALAQLYDGDEGVTSNSEAYEQLGKQTNNSFDDFGQVTYTAVGNITFNSSGHQDYSTHVYVQNQQYLQRTQAVLKIIDLIDFTKVYSDTTLRNEYTKAANEYLSTAQFLPELQKQAIRDAVNNNTLVYNGINKYSLQNQTTIVYNVSHNKAREYLNEVRDKGYDELIDEFNRTGIDVPGSPYMLYDRLADGSQNINYGVTYYKMDEDGDVASQADMTVMGKQVNRNYAKILEKHRGYQPANVEKRIDFGAKFAIASTFQEKSDFISIPNLKPYFTRQVNKSIRNATKTKEENGDASAGERSIKQAVKVKGEEYATLLENTVFTDDKYRDPQKLSNKDTTPLFTKFKPSDEDGLTYYYTDKYENNNWVRRFNEKHTKFKGYNLYDSSGFLKAPSSFVTEKRQQLEDDHRIGKSAIDQFYKDDAKNKENAVANKNTALGNELKGFHFSDATDKAKDTIEGVVKPNIEHDPNSQGEAAESISLDVIPEPDDVFLGEGTTGNGLSVTKTGKIRKDYDKALSDYRTMITTNYDVVYNSSNDTYSLPKNTSGMSTNDTTSIGSDLNIAANTYYRQKMTSSRYFFKANSGGVSVTEDIELTGKYYTWIGGGGGASLFVENGSTLHTGNINGTGVDRGEVKVTGGSTLYVHGDIKMTNKGYITVEDNSTLIVSGKIECTNTFRVQNGAKIIQLSPGSQMVKFDTNTFVNSYTFFTVGEIYSNPDLNLGGNSAIYCQGNLTISDLNLSDNACVYVKGNISSSKKINTAGNTSIYCLGSIYSNRTQSDDLFDMTGTSKVYVRGALTTENSSKQHVYIHNSTGCVLSILGEGFNDCFDNKCNQIYDGDSSSGTKIYLGKNTRIYDNNNNNLCGSLYCYGSLVFDSNQIFKIENNKELYIAYNFEAQRGTVEAKGGATIYSGRHILVKKLVLENQSRAHSTGNTSCESIYMRNNAGLDVMGIPPSNIVIDKDNSSMIYNGVSQLNFNANDIVATGFKDKVHSGEINKNSMTLSGCKIKIEGNVDLDGDLTLTNTVLYITGELDCANVTLKAGSELYVENGAEVKNVNATGGSLFLVRKDSIINILDLANNSDLEADGTISAVGGSMIYVDGAITAKAYTASGKNSKILGYKAANIKASADFNRNSANPTEAFYNPDGLGAEIFCGVNTTFNVKPGLIINGYFFLKPQNGGLTVNKLHVKENGFCSIGGAAGNLNTRLTVDGWAAIDAGGTYLHNGTTKIKNCRITNKGNMYFRGGVDMTEAATGSVNGANKSDPDFLLYNNSESYIGKFYDGSTRLDTYTYKGNFEVRGNTYFDSNIIVNGWTRGKNNNSDKGPSDLLGNNGLLMWWLGVSVYIPNGTTYINGYLKTYSSTSNETGVLIGNANFSDNNQNNMPGLVLQGNLKTAGPIYNFGKTYIFGQVEQNNSNVVNTTDLRNNADYHKGRSILNGTQRGFIKPVFFCSGTKNSNGTFNKFQWDLIGYIDNYANMYVNADMNIKGFVPSGWDDNPYWGDYAFINGTGAKCFFGGWCRLNSKRIINEWTDSSGNESIFSCQGKLTFGSIVYNCSKMYIGGDCTNNESDSETCRPTEKRYRDDMVYLGNRSESNSFSFMNGCYKVNAQMVTASSNYENNGWTHFNSGDNMYDDAEFYCGGTLQFGKMKYNGSKDSKDNAGGSVMSVGDMYVGGDMNVFSFDETGSGLSGYKLSYYYTALWMWHNTNTFVGGNAYSGAGTVVGSGSMFMVGKNFSSARALKFNANIYVNYNGNAGIGNHVNVDAVDRFREAYLYVGENLLANTFGRTNLESGSTVSMDAPKESSRDTKIYSNSNVYIGGSLYNNAALKLYQNVTMLVAGQKDLISQQNGAADVIEAYTNGIAANAIKDLLDCNYRAFIYQFFEEGFCSNLVVNGHMYVQDTVKIKDMCQNYIYGSFSCNDSFELGQQKGNYDETDAKYNKFRTPKEKERIAGRGENTGDYKDYSEIKFLEQYKFENAPYMAVDGVFSAGARYNPFKEFFSNLFSRNNRYVRLYASATLRANGDAVSYRYFDLRHDAKLYANGNIKADTNIDAGSYTHLICTGAMTAEGKTGIYNKGYIRVRDQSLVLVGDNMYAGAYIEIGKDDDFKRTLTTINKIDSLIVANPTYDGADSEYSGGTVGEDDQVGADNATGSESETAEGTYTLNTENDLIKPDDNDNALGTEVFVKGSMIAMKGYLLECAYSSIMVGQFLFADNHITIRHNADLWVMPEMFGNETFGYSETGGFTGNETVISLGLKGFFENIWKAIKGQGFEFNTKFTLHSGSAYTLGKLFVGKNASLMGTYDCLIPGQCILRHDSLVYMGHNFTCFASTVKSGIEGLWNKMLGKEAVYTGFDALGKAGPGKKFICKNWKNHEDKMYYPMTVTNDEIPSKIRCPKCKRLYDLNNMSEQDRLLLKQKDTQVSHPVVVYAQNSIDIVTTMNLQLAYIVANKGKVNIHNIATSTKNAEKNARELPNAICSYQNDIDYYAWSGKLGSLFYAPKGNINLDGLSSEIWGCVLGNTVEMNSYYLAIHRFENWNTMQLNIAESGNIYLISEREWLEALERPEYEDDEGGINEDLPEGAQPFFF